jgi:septal ring-binding cell division protein DamX
MPDLNLQDDESLENVEGSAENPEEATTSEEEPAKKGGMTTIIVVVLAVLILGGGGAFLLNKLGVIHIFGKGKPAPAVVQLQDQQAGQQPGVKGPSGDAGQTQMIETPPVEEKGSAKKGEAKTSTKMTTKEKSAQPTKEMPATPVSGKLADMKGEYTVQVSAWRDKEIAQEIVKRLEDAGYPAFVEDRQYSGGLWYTVRVGRYASRKEAQSAVQNFAEELKSNYWIDKAK